MTDRVRERSFEDAGALSEPPDISRAGDGNRGGEAVKSREFAPATRRHRKRIRSVAFPLIKAVVLALFFVGPLSALEITKVTPAEYEARVLRPHRGRVLLVNFWATWCEPCREEMPALLAAAAKMRSKGADVVLVSADDLKIRETRVRPFLQGLRVTLPCFIEVSEDPQTFIDRVDPKWGGELPRSVLYDRNGRYLRAVSTAQTEEQFEKLLSLGLER